ncbi:hypothetical protein I307_06345 [Cryptococcus deuterogattii 99/473]|uniref:Uncharacterized protein n=1 Tax=Cryptococcus deuterogattii Ram5 TaxID=1296110 RepID=A0A0D0UXV7_9TREE|nr:hypothetical protein I313_06578 [Cryptococcus deuterogattii Ram5]KIY54343.1 hypothetical protein I307_06345 [Cryptococcus deuterogattii 99/473]
MPYPRPPHTIELVIPHLLTDSQFEMLEDLTFMHFEGTLEAWPISLKIITELYECITLPLPPAAAASPEMPPCRPPPSKDEYHTKGEGEAEQLEGRGGKTTKSETTTTKISVSTSKEWDPASEEAVRRIVRNILVEIMGGGIQVKRG